MAPSSAPSAIICGSPPPENVFLPVPWERHPGPLRLLFVGRLIEQKGVLDLIEAVRLLNARTPRVSLTVMGKGPASRDIRAAVAAAELGTQVRLVPWGQGPDVHSQMAQSDLLVVPSKPTAQNREQWGRVVVEAMMTGRPTLVSDCGELPQMVPDTSWTFQAGDALDLARRIESIIDSNDWLPRNSSLALTWGERFTPTSQVRVLDRFWQDVLSSRG
ncbi:MAG: glycosyltransferase family 4 protein [Candidatus Nanopelagicales bacterium]